jgi:hypothetical protein
VKFRKNKKVQKRKTLNLYICEAKDQGDLVYFVLQRRKLAVVESFSKILLLGNISDK